MTRSRRGALLAGALLAFAAPAEAQRPKATATDAIAGITGAFASHPLVALGENHGDVAQHALLRRLVADPRFSRAVDDVVIEAGSARHQRVVDRYVAGKPVSRRALTATWRDSIGGGALGTWDAPVYERFLRTIRQVNRRRPAEQRLRVLLGDPPVKWEEVRTREQLHSWAAQRDSHFASVVDEQVMRKGRRALLIAGMFHFHRDAKAPARSVLQHVEDKHPGKVFHVALPTFDPAGTYGAAYEYTRSFPADSLVALDGTDLGALRAPRPPQAPQAPTEEENAEAWLIPDPARNGWSSNAYPTAFEDRWWDELRRRLALEGDMDPDEVLAEHCAYSTLQGAGLDQAVQPGAASGEPNAGAGGGEAPGTADALDAILAQLRAGRTVAIGESRGLDQLHALVRKLVGSGRIPGRRPQVVVGFGNSRHQRVADRYVAGERVSGAALARVWQDTSQLLAYDAPMYEAFFEAVRDANRKLPAERRIRVLLGEPPLDWKAARGARDVERVVAQRAAFLAGLAMRAERGRSVIVVADRKLLARVPGSATHRLPDRGVWVLQPYLGARPLGDAKPGSALTVAGSRLAKLASGRNLSPAKPGRELGRTVDALLYLGAPETLTTHAPLPTRFRDAYVREVRRRHELLYGTAFRPAAAFPTSECSSPAETVGDEPPAGGGGDTGRAPGR